MDLKQLFRMELVFAHGPSLPMAAADIMLFESALNNDIEAFKRALDLYGANPNSVNASCAVLSDFVLSLPSAFSTVFLDELIKKDVCIHPSDKPRNFSLVDSRLDNHWVDKCGLLVVLGDKSKAFLINQYLPTADREALGHYIHGVETLMRRPSNEVPALAELFRQKCQERLRQLEAAVLAEPQGPGAAPA